jgi:DNA-directed RNA polymerase subunit RPC12/RpoP
MSKPAYTLVACTNCGSPTRLVSVVPVSPDTDEITYRCDACGKEIKQQAKPKSLDGP